MKSLRHPSSRMGSNLNLPYSLGTSKHFFNNLPEFQEVPEMLDVFPRITLRGKITNHLGLPVSGVLVEMWHPVHSGYFGLEYGPSFAPTDPDRQGWACTITNEKGEYFFQTEKRTNQSGLPSASIDLKITDEYANVILTKMYFDEDLLDPADYYLMDMEVEERCQHLCSERDGVCYFDMQI